MILARSTFKARLQENPFLCLIAGPILMSTMATFKGPQEISEADRFKQKFPQGAPKQSDFLRKRLQGKGGAKYFDSGDYNMAKSTHGRVNVPTGKAIPTPETLPHRKLSSTKQSNLVEGTSPPPNASPEEKGMVEQHKAKQQITDEQDSN